MKGLELRLGAFSANVLILPRPACPGCLDSRQARSFRRHILKSTTWAV